MPITVPSVGDPTRVGLASDIINALAALEIDIAAVLGERMVNNGSFEVDTDSDNLPDGWETTRYSGGSEALTTDVGAGTLSAHGAKAYKFTHPGGGGKGGGEIYTAAGTYIEITPNRGYWVSWMNKNSVAGVTNSVEVLEYDATQSLIGSAVVIFSATTNPTAWKQFRAIYYPTSALCRYIRLKFKCGETSASTAGDIYLDNIEMARVPRQTTILETVGSWKWTCPPGVRFIELELIGAGGGGGGCNGSGTGGGGGGAGAYLYANVAVTPGTTYDFAIGAGGTSSGTTSGTNGGNTTATVGATTYTAAGGTGGTRGSSGGAGGAGGAATNGDTNTTGVSGGNGTGAPAAGSGGYAAPFSFFAGTNSAGTTGSNGPTYGAGGSGGRTGTDAGGSGANGVAIIRW
jgi:hypothetical protein